MQELLSSLHPKIRFYTSCAAPLPLLPIQRMCGQPLPQSNWQNADAFRSQQDIRYTCVCRGITPHQISLGICGSRYRRFCFPLPAPGTWNFPRLIRNMAASVEVCILCPHGHPLVGSGLPIGKVGFLLFWNRRVKVSLIPVYPADVEQLLAQYWLLVAMHAGVVVQSKLNSLRCDRDKMVMRPRWTDATR